MRQQYDTRQSRREDGNPLQDIMQLMALSKMFGPEADQEQQMKQLQYEAAQQQMQMQAAQMEQAQQLNPLQLKHLQAQIAAEQAASQQAQALNPLQLQHIQAQLEADRVAAADAGPNAQTMRDYHAAQIQNMQNQQDMQRQLVEAQTFQIKQPQLAANMLEPSAVGAFPYDKPSPISYVPDAQQAAVRQQLEPLLTAFRPEAPQMGVQLEGLMNTYPGMIESIAAIDPAKAAILKQWHDAAQPYVQEYKKLPPEVTSSPFEAVQGILANPQHPKDYQRAHDLHKALLYDQLKGSTVDPYYYNQDVIDG